MIVFFRNIKDGQFSRNWTTATRILQGSGALACRNSPFLSVRTVCRITFILSSFFWSSHRLDPVIVLGLLALLNCRASVCESCKPVYNRIHSLDGFHYTYGSMEAMRLPEIILRQLLSSFHGQPTARQCEKHQFHNIYCEK